jgi:predicted secreted protein
MERNRILLLVAVAAVAAIVAYRLTSSSQTTAVPEPVASASAGSSASASPMASSSAPTTDPSAAAAVDAPDSAAGGEVARTTAKADSDGGGMVVGMGASDGGHGDTVFVDQAKADTTVSLGSGQKLVVVLRSNPTTGFDWSVVKAPPALGKPEMGSIPGAGVGGGGHRKLTFTPKEPLPAGEHTVELAYARPFEDAQAPLKTFRFKVKAGG